jgi:hypothetical protein
MTGHYMAVGALHFCCASSFSIRPSHALFRDLSDWVTSSYWFVASESFSIVPYVAGSDISCSSRIFSVSSFSISRSISLISRSSLSLFSVCFPLFIGDFFCPGFLRCGGPGSVFSRSLRDFHSAYSALVPGYSLIAWS